MEAKSPKNSAKKTPKKSVEASPSAAKVKTPKSASKKAEAAAAPAAPSVGEHRIVNMNQVNRAAISLKKHVENLKNKPGAKNPLFATEHPVTVDITLHKVPIKGNLKRKIIPISTSFRDADRTEICIFVRDAKVAKHKLALGAVPHVKKVIALGKLRTHYNQYEARRTLAQSYDLFLCEDAILPDVCKQLGSSFLKIRKSPIAIKIGPTIADTIAKIRDSTLFELSAGVTQSYKIGHTGFSEQALSKNFLTSIDHVVTLLPLGWSNVKQIALTTTGSVLLPVYNNLTPPAPKVKATDDAEAAPSEGAAAEEKPAKSAKSAGKGTKRAAPSSTDADASPATKKAKITENGKPVAVKKTETTPTKLKAETAAASTPKPASATKTTKKTTEATKSEETTSTPTKAAKKSSSETTPAKSEKTAASTPKAASNKTSASPKSTPVASTTKAAATPSTTKSPKATSTTSTPKSTTSNKTSTPASTKSSTPAKTAKSPSAKTPKSK